MGGGGKSQTSTQQVSIPPEVLARYNAVNARAESVAATPFQQYGTTPEAFVAPLTQAQQQGIAQTQQYGQSAQPYFNAATQQLLQAQQQGQQQLAQAYQPLYQGYQTGQELGAGAQQYYTGAGAAALPFYQQAAGGLGAGLQYAGGLQGAALGQAAAAPGYAAPLQQYGAEAITGAPGAAAMPNMAAMRMGLGAARQAAPYYGAATAGTQAALQESAPYQGLATQAALAGSQAISPEQFSQQGINRYMSPFLSNVVQQTMAAQAQQNAQQRQALTGEAIKAGAFGGDRAGIAQANLAYQQNLANQQTIANLLQGGYGQALGAFQQQQGVNLAAEQANRAAQQQLAQQALGIGQQGYGQQLGAAQQMAGLGQALYGQGIQGAQTLSQLGQTQYGQQLGAGQAAAGLGQQLYGQGMTGAQFLQGLGQQGFAQQLAASQQQQAMGQGLAGLGFQTGQALQGLGAQQAQLGQTTAAQQAALAQAGYGMGAGSAQALAGLGQGAQAAGLQGAQAMLGAGQIQQQTEQAGKQALYNQFLQQQGYPFQVAQFLANIAMGTGALSGSTTTTTQPAPFFSDRKLKENIRKIGETKDGLPIYKFRYKGEKKDQTHIGYMADEVEKKHPDAVGEYGGAKYVDYNKVNARESMGGAVRDGGLGRAAYNPGGSIDSTDMSGLLASNRKALGLPETGIHGQSPYELPRGGKSHVPTTGVYIPKLITPSSPPRAPQSGMGQGMDAYKTVRGLASDIGDMKEGLTKGYDWLKGKAGSDVAAPPPAKVEPTGQNTFRNPEDEERAGNWRGGYAGGGMPYGSEGDNPYDTDEQNRVQQAAPKDVLGDVVQAGKQQIHSLPKPGEPPKPPSSGLGDAAKMVGMGKDLVKGAGQLFGESGPLAGILGGGAEAAGAAAGVGEAAAGLGAAAEGAGMLGTLGTAAATAGEGIMAALPFLAFLSDERTKENKRVVGELFNGEKVIAYNHPGMPTQIGLGAQHVEKRDPYSVWENEHGLKFVDYDRATRNSGGLVPRHGYATDGAVEPEDYFEKRIIPIESGGRHFDKSGNPLTSSAGAIGIAQVMPGTAPEAAKLAGLPFDEQKYRMDQEYNKALGRAYYNAQVERFGDPVLAAAAYNAGPGNVQKALAKAQQTGGNYVDYLPAETQAYVAKFSRGEVAPSGGSRQVASTEAGAPSGFAEKAQGLGDFLTSSKFLVPLGTGLLTMASSPSRYLGAAALQGLGAGLASMQKPEMAEAQIEEKKQAAQLIQMQKFAEQGRIAGSAFLVDKEGRLFGVRVYRGNTIETVQPEEYYRALREGRPYKLAPMGGAEGTATAEAGPAQAAPAGTGTGAGAATGPQIGDRGAPQGEVPVYRGLDSDMQRFLNDRVREVQVASPARLAADPTNIPFTQQDAAARSAQSGTLGRNTYANAISSLDLSNRGKFAEQVKTPILQWFRDTARSFNVPDSVLSQVVSFDQLAQPEILRKIRTQAGFERDNAAKQRSFESFMAQLEGLPGQGNSPEAASALVAELLLTPQRDIDLNNFYNLARDYAVKKGGIPADQAQYIGRGLEQKFMERQQEKYAAEKKAIMDMMFTPIKVPDANGQVKQMNVLQYLTQTGGNVPPKVKAQIEGMFGQDITRVFGGR